MNNAKRLLWRISAIICDGDSIDLNGHALPFEESSLIDYGKELNLDDEVMDYEISKALSGFDAVSEAEWDLLRGLDAKEQEKFFERVSVIAGADGEFADEEKNLLEKVRSMISTK